MSAPIAAAAVGAGFQAPPVLVLAAASLVDLEALSVALERALEALLFAEPVAVARTLLRLEISLATLLVILAISLETCLEVSVGFGRVGLARLVFVLVSVVDMVLTSAAYITMVSKLL